jgi:hypothetical protein
LGFFEWLSTGQDVSNFVSNIIGFITGLLISYCIYLLQGKIARQEEKNLEKIVELTNEIDSYTQEHKKLYESIRLSSSGLVHNYLMSTRHECLQDMNYI